MGWPFMLSGRNTRLKEVNPVLNLSFFQVIFSCSVMADSHLSLYLQITATIGHLLPRIELKIRLLMVFGNVFKHCLECL